MTRRGLVRWIWIGSLVAGVLFPRPLTAETSWWPEGWYDTDQTGRPGYYPDIEKMKAPFYWNTAEPFTILSVGFIRFYQTVLSRTRSGNCPLWPSCSRYTLRAISDYGPYLGWIMALDRMFLRENGDIYRAYPRIKRGFEMLPFDPPRFDYLFKTLSFPLQRDGDETSW